MKVLIVEPMKPCYVREISGLNDMQEIVGGHIEAIYPFKEQVAIIANEEGKSWACPSTAPCQMSVESRMTSSAGHFLWPGWEVKILLL